MTTFRAISHTLLRVLSGRRRWLACCGLLGAVSAHAQPTPVDLTAMSLEQLLDVEVISASKFAQKTSDAPSSVTLVSRADIQAAGYRTLGDILAAVRGFYVTSDRVYQYVGVRGFAPPGDFNDRLLVMIDGYRTNENIFDQGFIGSEFMLDIDLIDRVEIVRGPSSSVYGSNALFGIVNVITRRGQEVGAEVAASVGRYRAEQWRASYGRPLDNGGDLLLSASRTGSRGDDLYFPEFDARTYGADYERNEKLFGKFSSGEWSITAGLARRGKGNPAALTGVVFNDPANIQRDEQGFIDARWARSFAAGTELSARVFHGSYDFHGDYLYDPPPRILNIDKSHGRWWGGELKWLAANGRHRWVSGLELQANRRQDMSNYDSDPFAEKLNEIHRSSRWGVYVQDEYQFGEQFSLTGGVRFDRSSGQDGRWSPRLAAVIKPSAQDVVKLMYGSAFRAPNTYELSYGYPDQQIGNPTLKPENIKTYEATLEHFFHRDLKLTLSGYYYVMQKQIGQTSVPNPDVASLVPDVLQFLNQDTIRGRGLEVEVERAWEGGGHLRSSLELTRAADATGRWLDNSPRVMGKLNFRWPVANHWRLNSALLAIGPRTTWNDRVKGYAVANLTISRPLESRANGRWEFSAGVYNLFDRRADDPSGKDVGFDNGLLTGATLLPRDRMAIEGRIWQLKLAYRF
ncbi:MAG TPA: TonB-dependent receptor [Rhodocyclaceae bacterium]|nr:TonB-dependent receptor [Rhodocyclaceae bacterium]